MRGQCTFEGWFKMFTMYADTELGIRHNDRKKEPSTYNAICLVERRETLRTLWVDLGGNFSELLEITRLFIAMDGQWWDMIKSLYERSGEPLIVKTDSLTITADADGEIVVTINAVMKNEN